MSAQPGERRRDKVGVIVVLASAAGYVMVRRPGCLPFVLSAKEWRALAGDPS